MSCILHAWLSCFSLINRLNIKCPVTASANGLPITINLAGPHNSRCNTFDPLFLVTSSHLKSSHSVANTSRLHAASSPCDIQCLQQFSILIQFANASWCSVLLHLQSCCTASTAATLEPRDMAWITVPCSFFCRQCIAHSRQVRSTQHNSSLPLPLAV